MPGCWMVIFSAFGIGVTKFLKIKFLIGSSKKASGCYAHEKHHVKIAIPVLA